MPGFGRCPSPLPREWPRFLGCAVSRLMKFARDGSQGSSWPSPESGDPAGLVDITDTITLEAASGTPVRAGVLASPRHDHLQPAHDGPPRPSVRNQRPAPGALRRLPRRRLRPCPRPWRPRRAPTLANRLRALGTRPSPSREHHPPPHISSASGGRPAGRRAGPPGAAVGRPNHSQPIPTDHRPPFPSGTGALSAGDSPGARDARRYVGSPKFPAGAPDSPAVA